MFNHKKMPKTVLKKCQRTTHNGIRFVWIGRFRRNRTKSDGLGTWCDTCRKRYRIERERDRLESRIDELNNRERSLLGDSILHS